ncbi:hypothetical protein D3C87_1779380 [compost metagenome]
MAETLQFEGGPPPHQIGLVEHGLERNHHLFPAQNAAWPPEDAPRRLFQPSSGNILAPQRRGVASRVHPGRIDQQAFRKPVYELV